MITFTIFSHRHPNQMALLTSTVTTVPTVIPAKSLISSCSILRTPCVILRPPLLFSSTNSKTISIVSWPLRAFLTQKYVYPDPIPEFAIAETQKFRAELLRKLSKEKETFGDELHFVINVCAEIFSEFLHKEYGGPGTLLVEPFMDMLIALKEKTLPGAPLATRASLLWAQNYVDQDWEIWNSKQVK